jgi:hypothetical protein
MPLIDMLPSSLIHLDVVRTDWTPHFTARY